MIWSLSFNILNATIIPISIPIIVFSIIFFLIIFTIVFHNHYTFLTTFGIIAAAALFLLASCDDWPPAADTAGIWNYLTGLTLFIRGYLPYDPSYGPVITFLVCGFLGLYMTLSLYVTFQFYFTALLGIGIFTINWIMDYKRSDLSFIIFVFCFCVLLYKKMNNRKVNVNLMAIYMMPVMLVVVVSASLLPMAAKNWDNTAAIEFFRNPLEYTNDFFYFIFNPKYFSFQTTGFEGRDGRLGGSLNLNNRDIMRIKADSSTYLAGIVKDTYTGNAWINSKPGFTLPYSEPGARFEAIETQLNMPLPFIFEAELENSVSFREMTINIGSSRTGTIFRPMKNNTVQIETDLELLTDHEGNIRLSDVLPANAEYSFEYMDVDYTDPAVQNLLRKSRRGIYREGVDEHMYLDLISSLFTSGRRRSHINIDNFLNMFQDDIATDHRFIWGMWEYMHHFNQQPLPFDPADYFNDSLIPYAESIYETYLGVPETVPQRVRDLADDLISGIDNNYDRAKAIESYLINFPYTLMPGMPPQGQDFVDYFLFEGQEGYCTYYASAMAVLCRLAGIPTRYIEGYVMPPTVSQDGFYYVTNLQAHAWVELYFEGFGWAPFEPTAPYSFGFYNTMPPLNMQVFSPDFYSDPFYEEYMMRMMGRGSDYGSDAVLSVNAGAADNEPADLKASIFTAVLVMLLIIVCFIMLCLQGRFHLWRRQTKIQRMSRNEQAIEYYRDIIKMTRYYRYPMHEFETPAAYAGRIGKRFAFINDSIFIRDLTRIYNKSKYAESQINKEELTLMKTCREELLAFIRSMRWKPVFIWNRYITRKI